MNVKIAAIVVAYLPDTSIGANLQALAQQVDRIYLVDNSPSDASSQLDLGDLTGTIGRIVYLPQGTNTGIAEALNIGCARADRDGYEWVLTMDQDSCIGVGMVKALHAVATGPDAEKTGIAAPEIWDARGRIPPPNIDPPIVFTSGSLTRIAAWKALGGFDELLFIDAVDIDFCLRLAQAQWQVVTTQVRLQHVLGGNLNLFGRKTSIRSYSAFRRYFQARNAIVIAKRHGLTYPRAIATHCYRVYCVAGLKLLLFQQGLLFAFFRGILDGIRAPNEFISGEARLPPESYKKWRAALIERASKA